MKSNIHFLTFLLFTIIISNISLSQSGSEYFNVGMFSVVGGTASSPIPGTQEFRDELQMIVQGSINEMAGINTIHSYHNYIGDNNFLTDYLNDISIVSDSLKTLADCRFIHVDLNDDGTLSQEEMNTFISFFDAVLNDQNEDHIAGWYIADEPTSVDIDPVELEKIYDAIKMRDSRPIYIAESPSTVDFSRFPFDILIIDYYYYSINNYTDWATLSLWKDLITDAREDLNNAGRENAEIHALLVAGEEIFPDSLNEELMTSHGLMHSAIRRVLNLGVDGIWFYAWRAGVINSEDAVHRWINQQKYAEAIETEMHDKDFLVTSFCHSSDNKIVISDIGNYQSPDDGQTHLFTNDVLSLTSGDFQGSNELDGDPVLYDLNYNIDDGFRTNSDGDDELITVFANGDIFYSEEGNKPDDILIDSFLGDISAMTSGDFDGDGDDELVTAMQNNNECKIFISDDGNTGSIEQYQIYFSDEFKVTALTTGDFNGDGRDELVTAITNSQLQNSFIYVDDIAVTGQAISGSPWYGPDNTFHVTALASGDFSEDKLINHQLIFALSNSELQDTRIYSTTLNNFSFDSAFVIFGPEDYWHVTAMTSGDFVDDEQRNEDLIIAFSNSTFDHTKIYKTDNPIINGIGDIIYDPGFPSYYYVSSLTSASFRESLHPVVSNVDEDFDNNETIVQNFKLYQNYPNPFNPTTKIKFRIPNVERFAESLKNNYERIGNSLYNVTLKIYDILGNEISTLINGELTEGEYEITFNASRLSSGIYFYQLITGSIVLTKQMVLIK